MDTINTHQHELAPKPGFIDAQGVIAIQYNLTANIAHNALPCTASQYLANKHSNNSSQVQRDNIHTSGDCNH